MRTRSWIAVLLLPLVLLPAAPAVAGGGCHEFTDASGAEVDARFNCFVPAVARVEPGDTVVWRNADGVPHNITTSAGFGAELPQKQDFRHRFTKPGVYPYACTLHPGMVGAVVVGDGLPVEADLVSATAPSVPAGTGGDAVGWWAVAGALALLVSLALSGRIRRQRLAGSTPS